MLQAQTPITNRPLSCLPEDISALNAIAQAAVNVELFTIPLYMTSLYSIYGTHQINGDNAFYEGRLWPGMSTTNLKDVDPNQAGNNSYDTYGNKVAFNAIFSVFIAEMLHLQLASNICSAIGVKSKFTGAPLQNDNFGWTCYGDDNTVLPHILKFTDCKNFGLPGANNGDDDKDNPLKINYKDIKVKLGPVDTNQINLFLAIEETEAAAHKILENPDDYFPKLPFKNWKVGNTAADLPLFGSIGYMYLSLVTYLTIQYEDKSTLWDHVFKAKSVQQDIFNLPNSEKHYPEYPGMKASVTADNADDAVLQILDMIDGITDQGEGHGVTTVIREVAAKLIKDRKRQAVMLQKVQKNYQPSEDALEKDYPAYNDKGEKQQGKSRDGYARVSFGSVDHFDTFRKVKELLDSGQIKTWADWHADEKNEWTAEMLKTVTHTVDKYPIPSAEDIAGALNRLKQNNGSKNEETMSHVVAGAIKGVTSVLNDYFSNQKTSFPFPSMSGSGDRMSLFWAVFGKAPDLSLGVENKVPGLLYHACQGLALDPNNPSPANSCAPVAVFHTCKGSNTCAAEGGCGFVQTIQGGSSCGGSTAALKSHGKPSGNKVEMLAATSAEPAPHASLNIPNPFSGKPKTPVYYNAPSDNRCMSFGGCAVPISASQLFPSPDSNNPGKPGEMELFNFLGTRFEPVPINTMGYQAGDLVYDVAWNAYVAVLQERNRPIPPKPKPSDIRLAFPPST